jgi:hypothetical protein
MNVKYGMLPTLLLLGALAACAPGYMSKEEAVKAGNEIKAFHETSTFAYPHDQVTFTDDSYSSKYETHLTSVSSKTFMPQGFRNGRPSTPQVGSRRPPIAPNMFILRTTIITT